MYGFHIEDMAELISHRLVLDEEKKRAVEEALGDYWADRAALTWHVSDVKRECPGLNDEQALRVLASITYHHDASQGVNWDTIRQTGFRLFGDEVDPEPEEVRGAVEAYAESLIANGDLDSFEAAFGSRDPDFNLETLDDDKIHDIYFEFVNGAERQ